MIARILASLAVLGLVGSLPAAEARQPVTYLVDTTADGPENETHCAGSAPCPLRSAVHLANRGGGGLVTAQRCALPGDAGCLSTLDPNYDRERGIWTFHLDAEVGALIMDREGITLDFRPMAASWSGPADNVVVIDGGDGGIAQGIVLQGLRHQVAGLEVRGKFDRAAIEVSGTAHDVVVGPGVVVADVDATAGIRLRDAAVTGNRVVGNWCGFRGAGRPAPVSGSCILIDRAAADNVVGGPDPADGNYLVGAGGAGILLAGPGADRNRIQNNWVGVWPGGNGGLGQPAVDLADAGSNVVEGNVLGRSAAAGVRVRGTSFGNTIRANSIGAKPVPGAADEPAPNTGWGIELRELAKGTRVEGNAIQYNRGGGVLVTGGPAENNLLTQNRVRRNVGPAIRVSGGANGGVEAPIFSIVSAGRASGIACGGCTVELYSDEDRQAWHYEGSAVALGGAFLFSKEGGFRGPFLTATSTRSGGTSSLSAPEIVPGAPTPTPDRPPPEPPSLYLPALARDWSR